MNRKEAMMVIELPYLITSETVMTLCTGVSDQVRFLICARRTVCTSWTNLGADHHSLTSRPTVTVMAGLTSCTYKGTRTLGEKYAEIAGEITSNRLSRPYDL